MMKLQKFVSFLLMIIIFQSGAGAQGPVEKAAILTTETGKIYGTVCTPTEGKTWPVALIISGSGPTDRNGNNPIGGMNNNLQLLAEGMAKNGIASLRFDKRGIGESKDAITSETDLRFDDYVNDVLSWMEWLKKDKRFTRLVVMGHSEGSLIGMIACLQDSGAAFVSLAGAGLPADSIIKEQVCNSSSQLCKETTAILAKIKSGIPVDSMSFSLVSLFRLSVQPYLKNWFQYDPAIVISKIKAPVLIIQGTHDLQVNLENADILHSASMHSDIAIFSEMNHILKFSPEDKASNFSTYNDPKLPLFPGLIERIVYFVGEMQ